MRFASLASEAWRSIASGTSQAALCSGLLGCIAAVTIGLDLGAVRTIELGEAAFHAAGADILVIQAPGRVSPSACEALGSLPGVDAGALRRSASDLVARALPSSGIPTFDVSPGLSAVLLAGAAASPGVLVSAAAAESLGLAPGDPLVSTAGELAVGGVYPYPHDGRRAAYEFAVLLPSRSAGAFDECWARPAGRTDDLAPLLLGTLVPSSDQQDAPAIAQLNPSLGRDFDGAGQFAQRPTRHLPLLGAALALVVTLALLRLRRVELAAARHSGVASRHQWAMALLETAVPVLVMPFVVAPVVAWIVLDVAPPDLPTYVLLAARGVVLVSLFAVAGTTVGALLIRERDLFSHFKERR